MTRNLEKNTVLLFSPGGDGTFAWRTKVCGATSVAHVCWHEPIPYDSTPEISTIPLHRLKQKLFGSQFNTTVLPTFSVKPSTIALSSTLTRVLLSRRARL